MPDFLNYTLLELPHKPALVPMGVGKDWATTIVRNWLYSQPMVMVGSACRPARRGAAGRHRCQVAQGSALPPAPPRDWLVRLGDGTDESHRRMQDAVDHLLPYTSEFWAASPTEAGAIAAGCGVDVPALRAEWDAAVDAALQEATLRRPPEAKHYVTEGKRGVHSEHLGYLLNELQGLARQHPGAVW